MKLPRLEYRPGDAMDFYEQGLASLGALCERTWHDKLQVIAEGSCARLWNNDGALHEIEIQFAAADATAMREAAREVFPGAPLTFRLTEALRERPITLQRFVLDSGQNTTVPDPSVIERLWRGQFPETRRWSLAGTISRTFHFSLVTVARSEVQALDQHWFAHRVAVSICDGDPDEALARDLSFQQCSASPAEMPPWPAIEPATWRAFLETAVHRDLVEDIDGIRQRQESRLQRELERVETYFDDYERELQSRGRRGASEEGKLKLEQRLAAARAERARRRGDQVSRHELRVIIHWDACLFVAEPAWGAELKVETDRQNKRVTAHFVPRSRRWHLSKMNC
jgi:hypothetical protein